MSDQAPALKISHFEGPLDLLCHLIEKNQIDIYDIPIVEVTGQYLAYLDGLDSLDMDSASSFLLMASTLLQIKSRMLLPQRKSLEAEDSHDPREELVLRLLEYRRCKTLANQLRQQHDHYRYCQLRLPEPPKRMGIRLEPGHEQLSWDQFWAACQQIARQNRLRYQDVSSRISHILKREKISLKEKMQQIWQGVSRRARIFFNELFPASRTSRAERVTGFLAVLELLRLNKINASQEHPFDVILLEADPAMPPEENVQSDAFLAKVPVEEKAYD